MSEEIKKIKQTFINPMLWYVNFSLILILFNLSGDFFYRLGSILIELDSHLKFDTWLRFCVNIIIPFILSIFLIIYQSKIIKKEYSENISKNIIFFIILAISILAIYIITNVK